MNYPSKRIVDVAVAKGGKRLPLNSELVREPTSHPYIRGRDIRDGRITFEDPVFVTDETYQYIARYTVDAGDVCITIVGNIGDVGITPSWLHGANLTENAVKIVDLHPELDKTFLAYALLSPPAQSQMKLSAAGAAQQKLGIYKVNEIVIPFPSLTIQRRISDILSAYDELIENNQRRIRILEDMTRSLYREWFVHFRYPGHESVPLVDSPLGQIPQGWEVKKLAELTSFLSRGLSPSYDDDGASLVINQKCIRDQRLSLEPARRQKKPIPDDKLVRFGDVLINSTGVGTLGRVAQIYSNLENCTVDTHVTIVRPCDNTDLDFFGCALQGQQENFERLGVGATGQTELGRAVIGQVELIIPPNTLQARFGALVRPMRAVATTLSNQAANLRRTRDLLLPRLLSGQVNLVEA